jgi:hypothetical protein
MVCTSAGWKDVDDDGGAGGFTSFDIDGDNNSPQTITDGQEALFVGGVGIATTAAATDQVTFDFAYADTLAGNPAFNAKECVFVTEGTSGGGFLCEGTTANTNEQLYLFPALDGADTTTFIALGASDGDALAGDSATSFFDTGVIEAARLPDTSTTAEGVSEAATAAEVTTGTDTARSVTPDALAGSNYGKVEVELVVFDFATDTATGDGKYYFVVPAKLNGWNMIAVTAQVIDVGTTGTLNVDLARCDVVATGSKCSGTVQDMLSTNLTIDTNEMRSSTAAAAAVIDTTYDDVDTDELIRVDVDAVHTSPAKSLIINLTFQLP